MKKYVLLAIGLSFVFSMSAQAKSGESLMSIQRSFREDANVEEPVLEMKGVVKSKSAHIPNDDVSLVFVDSESGKSYSLYDAGDLKKLHYAEEKDLLISLKATKSPKFLFWGGRLKVLSFEVLERLDTPEHFVSEAELRDRAERRAVSSRLLYNKR